MNKVNNINHFVKNIIPAGNLKEGYDFDIVSFLVFDMNHLEFQTVDQYYRISTKEIIEQGSPDRKPKEKIQEFLNNRGVRDALVQETDFYKNDNLVFYQLKDEINFNLALSLGFGIVRMKRGELKNQYLLYYTHSIGWDDDEDEQLFSEVLMLKAYFQLMYRDKFRDSTLERILDEDPHYILFSIVCNKWMIMDALMEVLEH